MAKTWRTIWVLIAFTLPLAMPVVAGAQSYGYTNPAQPYANGSLPPYAPPQIVTSPVAPAPVLVAPNGVVPSQGAPVANGYPAIPGGVPNGAMPAYQPAPGGAISTAMPGYGAAVQPAAVAQPIPHGYAPNHSAAQTPTPAPAPTLAPSPPIPIAVPNPVAPTAPTITVLPSGQLPNYPANTSVEPIPSPIPNTYGNYQAPAYQQPAYQQPSYPQATTPPPVYQPSPQPAYQGPSYQAYAPPMHQPTYETAPAAQPAPNYAAQGMPMGTLSPKEITPYSNYSPPSKMSTWVPRKMISLLPSSWTGQGAAVTDPNAQPNPPFSQQPYASPTPFAQGGYGQPNYGAPSCTQNPCCGPNPCWSPCGPTAHWYDNIFVLSEASAFKNPVDLDGLNGNYGKRIGAMASFPILAKWGLGGQIGSSAGWYDYKGSLYTGDDQRFQHYTTVGLFQRFQCSGFSYGVVHDWLYDDYYADMYFSQFRAAVAWQFNCNNEIGFWGTWPQARDEAFVGAPAVLNRFQSLMQGNFFWRHSLSEYAVSTIFAGVAESPSDITTGSNIQVAINKYAMLYGGFEYVLPGSGGTDGYQEEMWNLSLGMAFYPGTAKQALRSQFRPILPLADNGNFALWRE